MFNISATQKKYTFQTSSPFIDTCTAINELSAHRSSTIAYFSCSTVSNSHRNTLAATGLHILHNLPGSSLHCFHQLVHATQWRNQFPFNSTAKIAPRMHQNSPFRAQNRKIFWGGGYQTPPQVGRGTPYPWASVHNGILQPPAKNPGSAPVSGHIAGSIKWFFALQVADGVWQCETVRRPILQIAEARCFNPMGG